MNDRLPEMLWASLILASTEREEAFGEFVRIVEFVQNHERKTELKDLTITGIAELEDKLKKEIIAFITSNQRSAQALVFTANFRKPTLERRLGGVTSRIQTKHCNSL